MVRAMRMRQLQGKVMDVCMVIELQKQVLQGVGGTCMVLHFADCLHFGQRQEKVDTGTKVVDIGPL